MVWVRLPVYFYKINNIFYFSRSIPSDLRSRFQKQKIEVSLRTKSEAKATKSAAALSDRLERYWDSLRMEMIYSRELGLKAIQNATPHSNTEYRLSDALAIYHRLKGGGKTKLFFEVSNRSIRYLAEFAKDFSSLGSVRSTLFELIFCKLSMTKISSRDPCTPALGSWSSAFAPMKVA